MDMRDYSETLRPDLHMTDFSKEALVRIWEAAGKMYTSLAGNYQRVLRERLGERLALELDAEVWRRQTPVEVRLCRRAMSITGDDVASFFKHLQVDPAASGTLPLHSPLSSPNGGPRELNRRLLQCLLPDRIQRAHVL